MIVVLAFLLAAGWAAMVLAAVLRIESLLREIRDQTAVFRRFSDEVERRERYETRTRGVWEDDRAS